jgi:hypothetical protein
LTGKHVLIRKQRRNWILALGLCQSLAGCFILVDTDALEQGCAPNQKACNDTCVSRSDPEFGCGSSACQPCVLPNAQSICDQQAHCAIASCFGNYEDCDRDPETGCEVNLDTNVDHCGACDAKPCEVPGAIPACARGVCAIRKCQTGFKDCNRSSPDGCEVNVRESVEHCGVCANQCEPAQACFDGGCR